MLELFTCNLFGDKAILIELTEDMNRRPNDVFAEVDKILMIYKIFGLCSWRYSLGEFKNSWKWSLASFFTLWPFIVYCSCIAAYQWLIVENSLDYFLDASRVFSVVITLFLTWLMNHFRLDSFNRSLREIQVVDHYLFSVGEQVPPSKPSKMILSMIAAITLPFSIYLFAYTSYGSSILAFSVFYTFILMLVVQLFLDRLCTILYLRYRATNNVLRKCLTLQGKNAAVLLEKMALCYKNLSSSSECMNDFFSWQILFILTSTFIMSFNEAYAILSLLCFEELFDSKKLSLILHGCGLVITLSTIWRFGHKFSSITNEAKSFNSLLFRIMIEDKTNTMVSNEKLMFHFTMNREVFFTACGLFKLDYTLVHSMIASATTYLVLLIQFGKLPDVSVASTTSITTNLRKWSTTNN